MQGRSLKGVLSTVASGLLPGVPILGIVIAARLLGLFQAFEWQALDFGLRSRPAEAPDQRITLVAITEEAIQAIGDYPIPDGELVALTQKINQHQPRVLGLDIFRDLPVEPGHVEFTELVAASDNLVVVNKILPPAVEAPAVVPETRIGFVDISPDRDGFVRRSLLGATDAQSDYRFSFTIRIAEHYLADKGLILENGIRDPRAMRFGETELPRFRPNTGGYVQTDAGGEQTLINFRSGSEPFEVVTYQDIQSGNFSPELFEDRIVLIGVTAPSVKDIVNTAAIHGVNPGLVTGIELQAHAISQVVSAVLDGRPLLKVWPDWLEYAWIVGWGILGIMLARLKIKPPYYFVSIVAVCAGVLAISYSLLLASWWIPVVPTVMAFFLNGVVLYPSYRTQQELKLRLDERQQLIERTFDQIHNGPLQKLATVLARVSEDPTLPTELNRDLRSLNQELRGIYESLKQEFLSADNCISLEGNHMVSLEQPLHEMLYEVYEYTLQREEFPYFDGIKVHIRKFEPVVDRTLSIERKREMGRFLEEALCNVGKYAKGCSRLTVICMQVGSENVIRVVDNGVTIVGNQRVGRGTQQAMALGRRLGGRFERTQSESQGVCSELRWSVQKR
ncbi:MAG: CHASE2 domain-containing protein [Cyanobacteria bacterium J06635_15]